MGKLSGKTAIVKGGANGIGRGIAQAGLILGYIALGLALLFMAIFAIIFIVGTGAAILSPNG